MSCNYSILGRSLDDKFPNIRQYGARYAIILLFVMNLINFSDRYIPSAIKPLYRADLKLTDLQSSLPITATLVVYILSAPFFGYLSDYNVIDRRIILFSGIFLWSIATALAALSQNIVQLVCIRGLRYIINMCFNFIIFLNASSLLT